MRLLQLLWSFIKVGALSFGGGYAMIPMIQKEVITHRGWISMDQLIDMISISWVTPGPIAINSATFIGYRVEGLAGASAATAGVVLPSLMFMTALALSLKKIRSSDWSDRAFMAVRPVVTALVAAAGVSVARASVSDITAAAAMGLAFLLTLKTRISPFALLAAFALAGVLFHFSV